VRFGVSSPASFFNQNRKDNTMVALQQPPRRRTNLILHCGANRVPRTIVSGVPTPTATQTWAPIPHSLLIEQVELALHANRLRVVTQAHSLTHDALRYFGLMEIQNGAVHPDYGWVLGLRNSHDKRFPAGVVAGATVFVCDNLSFSGEIEIARKHTRFILRDLPLLTQQAIGRLVQRWHHQDERISAYKTKGISDPDAHDLIIRGMDAGVCSNRLIPKVLQEWRKPRHPEFEERNIWALFNSFTETLKKSSLAELPRKTEALHGLLDSYVGLN
jgi:hypothetical protein